MSAIELSSCIILSLILLSLGGRVVATCEKSLSESGNKGKVHWLSHRAGWCLKPERA